MVKAQQLLELSGVVASLWCLNRVAGTPTNILAVCSSCTCTHPHTPLSPCRLFEAADSDLAAVKRVLEDSRLQGYVVRLRGLPYSATAADVSEFFSGVQLSGEDPAIVFAQSFDGRPTGEAYVELANEEALSMAMMRHKELMGSRYIEIFHSSKVDKLQAQQQAHIHQRASPSHQQR